VLREPVQVAYAVDDVEVAAARFAAEFGAGPFFVRHHPPFAALHHGAAGVFNHSSAYGQWGAIQVELVQLGECSPPTLQHALDNTVGIHHVAMFVDSLDAEQTRLAALGMSCVMAATTSSGLRFAFHDARPQLGHLIEIYEPTDSVLRLYQMVREAAVDWDGSDPVR
jgi:hypothetical protein